MKTYVNALLGMLLVPGLVGAVPLPDLPKPVKTGPVRVLVAQLGKGEESIIERLTELKFKVVVLPWNKVIPDQLKDIDVILLPTQWAEDAETYAHFEKHKEQFHRFVKNGGGLLVCQPNPTKQGKCTPTLLPYPIEFNNWYDAAQPAREHLDAEHFITRGLGEDDLPFPADPMTKVDEHYTLLARQKSTKSPSLAVCGFGQGRVVVQTASENRQASIPIPDELVRRMVVWAAQREPRKK